MKVHVNMTAIVGAMRIFRVSVFNTQESGSRMSTSTSETKLQHSSGLSTQQISNPKKGSSDQGMPLPAASSEKVRSVWMSIDAAASLPFEAGPFSRFQGGFR
jgi:hypothetical protein